MKSHSSENIQTPGLVLGPLEKQGKTMKPFLLWTVFYNKLPEAIYFKGRKVFQRLAAWDVLVHDYLMLLYGPMEV